MRKPIKHIHADERERERCNRFSHVSCGYLLVRTSKSKFLNISCEVFHLIAIPSAVAAPDLADSQHFKVCVDFFIPANNFNITLTLTTMLCRYVPV